MTLKHYLLAFALLTTAIITGMLFTTLQNPTSIQSNSAGNPPLTTNTRSKQGAAESTTLTVEQQHLERMATLEKGMADLQARLASLERTSAEGTDAIKPAETGNANNAASILPDAISPLDALIKAGIDPFTAKEITDKQSSLQLARLELRDQALREGYLGSEQYREELQKIRQAEVQIRNEVNETAFDQYLFHTGQNNRIKVESVIPGSNAQNSGIKTGDMILRYEDKPLYNFRDLRSATIDGEKDEIVRVTVVRDGDQFTVSMPRGPLGVRLNFLRVKPEGL